MGNKQELIDEYLAKPIEVGDKVYIRGLGSQNKNAFFNVAEVIRLEDDGNTIVYKEHSTEYKVNINDVKKFTHYIGSNPFDDSLWRKSNNVNFSLESIIHNVGIAPWSEEDKYTTKKGFVIKSSNFNPFVEFPEKKYYQRDFVWGLDDMQSLIHSIYNGISCGKIVVRERSWAWNELRETADECAFLDIVDGKQRLTAIQKFLNNEYPDRFGNFYKDLSDNAQHKLLDNQLFSYSEMSESTTDEDVLKQFLSINFTGKPQSVEHINYVESILKSK